MDQKTFVKGRKIINFILIANMPRKWWMIKKIRKKKGPFST